MSARITQLDSDLLKRIIAAWQASLPKMLDEERSMEAMFRPMQENNTHWYTLPDDAFLLLRSIVPGNCATVQILTRDKELIAEPKRTREVLREAMQEFNLVRLNAILPSSLAWRDYKLLGFKHEGRIRKSLKFDGEWSDAEIMGALADEVGIHRRRRRKRRNKANAHAKTDTSSASQTPKDGEEIDAATRE